jgi:hypothetical protein
MEPENNEDGTFTGKFLTFKNLVLAAIAILTAFNTYTSTRTKNKLEIETMRIDTAQRALNLHTTEMNNIIKMREFENSLKMEMYQETKAAIGKDSLTQNATMIILNEMLDDDSVFRWKLKSILSQSPNPKAQAIVQQKLETFSAQQSNIRNDHFTVDVFYLDEIAKEALPRAKKVVDLLHSRFPTYTVRLRLLPSAINSQSGYRIDSNKIRFEKSEYTKAKEVLDVITAAKVFQLEQPRMNQITYHTPNYISIFVRNM